MDALDKIAELVSFIRTRDKPLSHSSEAHRTFELDINLLLNLKGQVVSMCE